MSINVVLSNHHKLFLSHRLLSFSLLFFPCHSSSRPHPISLSHFAWWQQKIYQSISTENPLSFLTTWNCFGETFFHFFSISYVYTSSMRPSLFPTNEYTLEISTWTTISNGACVSLSVSLSLSVFVCEIEIKHRDQSGERERRRWTKLGVRIEGKLIVVALQLDLILSSV